MKIYRVTFDQVEYKGGRIVKNVAFTTDAQSKEDAQEFVIELLESFGACHGNITSIEIVGSMPKSGVFPVEITA